MRNFSKYKNFFSLLLVSLLLMTGHSCTDDRISDDPSLRLSFSSDTLLFDTIFTTIGSSTQIFKVYNPNKKNLEIPFIALAGGASSPYRINVDGEQSSHNRFENLQLRARDSLFIFVEVKIDPLESNAPVFVKDSVIFQTNGGMQDVKLIAYGQNMEVLRNRTILNDTALTAEKPYLIYGDLVVDSAKTLRLEPGCRLYFHNEANLVVYGNLIAEGTREEPILIRGDRTDRLFPYVPYNYVSNQWGSVLLLNKEGEHRLNHVQMNSGFAGIFFSNTDRNFRPKLEIHNSRIHNFLKYGLVVQNGDVLVTNSEISNTGAYSVYLSGGKHQFIHCTIANYFNSTDVRIQPSGKENNAAVVISELNRIIPMETRFINSVIAGSGSNELEIFSRFGDEYHGHFSDSYIRKEAPKETVAMFDNIVWYALKDSILFNNHRFTKEHQIYYNFMPDSLSPIRGMANYDIAAEYPLDLNGRSRLSDGKPDAGAYQWQPSNKQP